MNSTERFAEVTNAELMNTDFVRLEPHTPLRHALASMVQARARYAIVVDDEHAFGLVSDRDLRLALPSRLDRHPAGHIDRVLDDVTVSSVCIRRPYVVPTAGRAAEAARVMVERHIGCLPVVDAHGRVRGLLTLATFAAAFAQLGTPSRPRLVAAS